MDTQQVMFAILGWVVVGLAFVVLGLYQIFSDRFRSEKEPDASLPYGRFGLGSEAIAVGLMIVVVFGVPLSSVYHNNLVAYIFTALSLPFILGAFLVYFSDKFNERFWKLTWRSGNLKRDRQALTFGLSCVGLCMLMGFLIWFGAP